MAPATGAGQKTKLENIMPSLSGILISNLKTRPKAIKTPSTQMWGPFAEALARAGVITHTLKDGELELAQ